MNGNNPPESYGKSVARIQEYLYAISQNDPDIIRTNPDGIYGEQTKEAVRGFQRKYSLSPTGKVDLETWQRLLSEYKKAMKKLSPPSMISPFSEKTKDRLLTSGDITETVGVIKHMLRTIGIEHELPEEISYDLTYDSATVAAVKKFQLVSGLEPSGNVDLDTWNTLAVSYNKYILYSE